MPFFYLHSSREQLCLQKRIPAHICFSLNHVHHTDPESLKVERSEAIIYSLVIVVFYAAIILIVVGTNMHRCRKRRQRSINRQHIITSNQKPQPSARTLSSPSIIVSIDTSRPQHVLNSCNSSVTPLVTTLSNLNEIDSTTTKGSSV